MSIIAGGGFARMASRLADERSSRGTLLLDKQPYPRKHWAARTGYPSGEYYRIIDNVDYAMAHFGMHGYGPVIAP